MSANTTTSPIIGQAVIVVTEAPAGRFQIRSFESPEGPSTAAGKWADRIVRLVHDAVTGAVVDEAAEPELARLRRIETAACEVLASGQARYDVAPIDDGCECPVGDPDCDAPDDGEWHCHDACEAPVWIGDLVPAAAMIALRAAVEGEVAP